VCYTRAWMCQWLFVATGLCPWLLNIVAKDVLGLCASKQLCLCITQNGQELECYEGVWRCGDEECIHTHAHTITHKLAHTHIHTRARTLLTGASGLAHTHIHTRARTRTLTTGASGLAHTHIHTRARTLLTGASGLAHTHIHTRARTLTTGASRPRKPEESADCEQCKDEERAAGH